MAAKVILGLCVLALFIQGRVSQICGLGNNGLVGNYGFNGNRIIGNAQVSGGGFPVTNSALATPTGLTIVSENVIEGPLLVSGTLPLLATISVDGKVPSEGQASVQYSCGGNVGISENAGLTNGALAGLGSGLNSVGLSGRSDCSS